MIIKFGTKKYNYSKPEKEIVNLVKKYFLKNKIKKVLDLGCGNGRHLYYLNKLNFEVYGIDKELKAVMNSKKLCPEVKERIVLGDIKNLPWENNFFDGIIANQVIYHGTVSEIKKSILEMNRVLKLNGLFFVTLQPREGQEWRLGRKIEDWTYIASAGPDKGDIHHYFDLNEIFKLFKRGQIIKVFKDNRCDWCVIGKLSKKPI